MTPFICARAVAAAALLACGAAAARADIKDYEFQLVDPSPRMGAAVIAVRLVNRKTGNTVPDAVIFATRIDMAPDGMKTMTSRIEVLPPTEPGVYRLRTDLTMDGGWRLSLAAKVQGETGTVEGRLILRAVK